MDKILFENFYEKNFKKVVNILRKTGVTDCEDLAQDIYLYFWTHPDKFEEKFFWHTVHQRKNSTLLKQKIMKEKFR